MTFDSIFCVSERRKKLCLVVRRKKVRMQRSNEFGSVGRIEAVEWVMEDEFEKAGKKESPSRQLQQSRPLPYW